MKKDLPTVSRIISMYGFEANGKTQLFVTEQARAYMEPYVPVLSHFLRNNVEIVNQGRGLKYPGPYAHYQYEGQLYVDPVTGKGAFYSEDHGFWSRPGVEKVPSGRPLKYRDPMASAHWDRAMMRNRGRAFIKSIQKWVDTEFK